MRTKKDKEKILSGVKKPKNHSGSFEKMTWDKTGLVDEIKNYAVDYEVNWSQLALKYGIKDSKGIIEPPPYFNHFYDFIF